MAGAAGTLGGAFANLFAVTLGNLVGGIIVALAVWFAYLRDSTIANQPACTGAMDASGQISR